MTEDFVRLSLDELEALKTSLQLLSKKEQKIMESSGRVTLNRLYNKLQKAVEDIKKTLEEVAQ
jgi:nicotinate-nucleotide pyrophosphorylase